MTAVLSVLLNFQRFEFLKWGWVPPPDFCSSRFPDARSWAPDIYKKAPGQFSEKEFSDLSIAPR
jgi:hypothetical protein